MLGFLSAFRTNTISCRTRAHWSALSSSSRAPPKHRPFAKRPCSVSSRHTIKPPFLSYRLIASTGHSPTQAPHSMQSSLIVALLFSNLIAPTGHTSSHQPQPMHFSSSITAAIENNLLYNATFKPLLAYAHNYHNLVMGICQ